MDERSSTPTSTPTGTPLEDDVLDLATGLSRQDLHRAALAVCAAATDVDDARYLLDALGLLDQLRTPERLAG